ncbi:Pyridoxamine 5'-phosphate oxidase [Lishizhenia tianjinensis]|uniref:Pyridoxine/pyridoxamine 5'-phosphate oxidase n=1 Tax=Lishizhenia tianjinensis TaxID=477690 RepID=A0A1I6XCV2_9FLAO|nr:pyridoxamine 5'-phosphate oxidase [Lishizhenia tianjinensis]SFT35953.1 Pyridoxamine 5'-phosphate oxidase [Lishizhenia tianjinensis]
MGIDFISKIKNEHKDFDKGELGDNVPSNPFDLFKEWYEHAFKSEQPEANALHLTTVNKEGKPSSRILYLKDITEEGFIFYTNYNSQKGREIAETGVVAGLLFWHGLERQIRFEGTCEKADAAISDAYFNSRPRGSKIGAWASHQSEELDSRQTLEDRTAEYEAKFPNEVPRPEHWGGYLIKPERFEFWQGRASRLHDRICYKKDASHNWEVFRKNP